MNIELTTGELDLVVGLLGNAEWLQPDYVELIARSGLTNQEVYALYRRLAGLFKEVIENE